MQTLFYSTTQAADRLGISRQAVHDAVTRGDLQPDVQVGVALGFKPETVEAYKRRRALNTDSVSQEGAPIEKEDV